ncbi:Pyruvate/Phosphoenolpyruvate kinase-like domain-containing protein [Parachaetomium inaequale]|uniref:Pyruvate/Phosphoenolpyruvate kinase-like domain-containing protein n=1 Tax=Parachaetomium inaequale TaxID=2588326 RepID=A0AAN6PCN0_9PEZI|nr:Pyruvate/Phosphoenolpyruvate kinase-like domain-containing protein [Parachaetomium inaequale]
MYANNLLEAVRANRLCKSFGIKISTNGQVVQIARNAGFDCLFIDLEHGWLSVAEAANLCHVGLLAGITPFVRVPHQCGNGFVQRVLDGGAMGVIFPHVESAEDAKKAVDICKYPPLGCRSITGQAPLFGMQVLPPAELMERTNRSGSTVLVMLESAKAVDSADKIAAVEGVDAIVVGSQDLCVDLGLPGQVDSAQVRSALEAVSEACRDHGKTFGVAGIYNNPTLQDWAINTLGARFLLVQLDVSLLTLGGAQAVAAVPGVKQ